MKTKNNQSSNWMYVIMIILIIAVVLLFLYIEEPLPETADEKTLSCIAENSKLYVSTNCPYCTSQKRLLGENLSMFNIIDCRQNPNACVDADIDVVPTWVIDGQVYAGYHIIKDLKEITNC